MEELKSEVVSEFVELMRESDATNHIFALISRAHTQDTVKQRCLNVDFAPIWDSLWENCLSTDDLRLFTLPNIQSYNQFAGMLYYKHYLETQDRNYLNIAASAPYRSFHAIRVIVEELLSSKDNTEQAMRKAVLFSQQARGYYPCAGALLCANVSFRVANRAQKADDIGKALSAYQDTLDHLWIAHKLAPFSEHELHNAYLGKGIETSNPWKVGDTWKLVTLVLDMLSNSVFYPNKELAEQRANTTLIAFEKMQVASESPRKKVKIAVI